MVSDDQRSLEVRIALLEANLSRFEEDLEKCESECASAERVKLLERIVFGLITLVLMAVATAIMQVILATPGGPTL